MTQTELFANTKPRRRPKQTLAQRRALRAIAEQQRRYDATRSNTALQRLKDAVTQALRVGA